MKAEQVRWYNAKKVEREEKTFFKMQLAITFLKSSESVFHVHLFRHIVNN